MWWSRSSNPPDISFGDFKVFAFGSDQEMVTAFGSLDAARVAWFEVRDEFLERWDLWGMPNAWWRFEPNIPNALRQRRHTILNSEDADEYNRIEMARRRYLVSIGIDPARPRRYRAFGSQ